MELEATRGYTFRLDISAAGYMNQTLIFTARRRDRANEVTVVLEPMPLLEEPIEAPILRFKRE